MSWVNHVRCLNRECGYSDTLQEGFGGAISTFRIYKYLEQIKKGELHNKEALRCMDEGGHFQTGGIYLCPKCKKFVEDDTIYFEMNGVISPFGTYRCDFEFPFGLPECESCATEMKFIPNVRSSKVHCPKCGSPLRVKAYEAHID